MNDPFMVIAIALFVVLGLPLALYRMVKFVRYAWLEGKRQFDLDNKRTDNVKEEGP